MPSNLDRILHSYICWDITIYLDYYNHNRLWYRWPLLYPQPLCQCKIQWNRIILGKHPEWGSKLYGCCHEKLGIYSLVVCCYVLWLHLLQHFKDNYLHTCLGNIFSDCFEESVRPYSPRSKYFKDTSMDFLVGIRLYVLAKHWWNCPTN